MIMKRAACLAFSAACLTGIATLPVAQAQTAYGTPPGAYGTPQGTYGASQPTYQTGPGQMEPGSTGNTEVVTNGPQGSPPPNWSARQTVRESEQYDRLLERNRGFRDARMRKECGPITDPQLHQRCIESFAQYEPSGGTRTGYGSTNPTGRNGTSYGR